MIPILKKVAVLSFLVLTGWAVNGVYAQDVPIEKFIGVWEPEKENMSCKMKISQDDGRIVVQIKGIIRGEATFDGKCLSLSAVEEVNYGKFWIGPWGGWYTSDGEWESRSENDILVGHNDGTYGTNGPVTGFYSQEGRRRKANKEIEYLNVRVEYRYEGTLEVFLEYSSIYYDGYNPLFYQSSNMVSLSKYTNW